MSVGDLEIDDDDVDSLVINHTGGGTLVFELDGNHVNDDPVNNNVDLITVNGGPGTTIARISDVIDLSDDNIGGADQLVLEDDAVLTLDVSQLLTIGYTDISVVTDLGDPADDTDPADNADLHLVGLGTGDLFDATQLDVNINLLSITVDPGNVALDSSVNLTGVGELIVQEGGSLTLTAAQFQQLAGIGRQPAGEGFQQGALAAAAAPYDGDKLTRCDVQLGLAQHLTLAVAFGQAAEVQAHATG